MHVVAGMILMWLLTGNNLANTINVVTAVVQVYKGVHNGQIANAYESPVPTKGWQGTHHGRQG